jgi:hypothetical protein
MMITMTTGMEERLWRQISSGGRTLVLIDDYLKARGSDDNPLCLCCCDGGKWMMMMGLMMAFTADRMW